MIYKSIQPSLQGLSRQGPGKSAICAPSKLSRGLVAILSLFTLYGCAGYHGSTLSTPFTVTTANAQPVKAHYACHPAPDPIRDIQLESIYDPASDNSSVVDPAAYASYIAGSKPLTSFEGSLTGMANRYAASKDSRIAVCAASWLDVWARGNALNGDVNRMGELVRKWVLSSVATTWIQIKAEKTIDWDQRTEIERWLRKVANNVRHDFPAHDERKSRNNNHLYWAAWGVMATGIALDDHDLYDWGLRRAEMGVNAIQKDGSLDHEMARGRKAFNYHSYAAIPLFMMAETALANGTDLYALNDQALFRLARLIISNINDPAYFAQITGEEQDLSRSISASNLVWLEPYYKRSHDPEALVLLEKFRPMRHSRVGGNLTQFYAR